MKFEMEKQEYLQPKPGDIVMLKNDKTPKIVGWIDGYYDLIDMTTGENVTTHGGCMSVNELLEDVEVLEIIPNEDVLLKRVK